MREGTNAFDGSSLITLLLSLSLLALSLLPMLPLVAEVKVIMTTQRMQRVFFCLCFFVNLFPAFGIRLVDSI